jgi:hypothetical protein
MNQIKINSQINQQEVEEAEEIAAYEEDDLKLETKFKAEL